MCDCFQIGGPWIAEDPNCPVHGTDAQQRQVEVQALRHQVKSATTFQDLQPVLLQILDLLDA